MNDLPEPLVPAEVDLRGLGGFMLRTDRLLSSELVALGTPEQCWAAVLLWCRAWQQQPAASLPNDERVLASFSGAGKRWPKVREMAMRGFVLCSDGRFYHRVLAEEALEAWDKRLEHRAEQERNKEKLRKWREKKRLQEEARNDDVTGQVTDSVTDAVTGYETVKKGSEGTGKGSEGKGREGKEKLNDRSTSAAVRRAANGEGRTVATWEAYAAAYRQRYSVDPVRNRKVNGQLAQVVERLGAEEAPAIAAFYVGHGKGLYVSARHCVDLLLRDAEGLRTEWATGRRVTDSEARAADRTATTGGQVERLIAEQRKEAA